jgi:hypothetical protein
VSPIKSKFVKISDSDFRDNTGCFNTSEEFFLSDEVPSLVKYSAFLAAASQLRPPFYFGKLKAIPPRSFWDAHVSVTRLGYTGFMPISTSEDEVSYSLGFGPGERFRYHRHTILLAGSPHGQSDYWKSLPVVLPDEAIMKRFTLCHPSIQWELHDSDGIYALPR